MFRWNIYPRRWKVSVWESKTRIHLLLARLLASCQLRNFLREFTEICFAVFDQSNCAIYLTWYGPLLFFLEFTNIIPFMVWFQNSSQIEENGYIFMSSIVCYRSAEVIFFNCKLNILSFIFLIWPVQFWIWFSEKLSKNVKIFVIF